MNSVWIRGCVAFNNCTWHLMNMAPYEYNSNPIQSNSIPFHVLGHSTLCPSECEIWGVFCEFYPILNLRYYYFLRSNKKKYKFVIY